MLAYRRRDSMFACPSEACWCVRIESPMCPPTPLQDSVGQGVNLLTQIPKELLHVLLYPRGLIQLRFTEFFKLSTKSEQKPMTVLFTFTDRICQNLHEGNANLEIRIVPVMKFTHKRGNLLTDRFRPAAIVYQPKQFGFGSRERVLFRFQQRPRQT